MNPSRATEKVARRQEMLSAVEGALQDGGNDMAGSACLSRYHFQRVFERTVGEAPGVLRRRLFLERAAYELRTTETATTLVAFAADYQTLEGFSRAF